MIDQLLPYIADSFPGLALTGIMAVYVLRRMARLEDRICAMLESCMKNMVDHLNKDDQ